MTHDYKRNDLEDAAVHRSVDDEGRGEAVAALQALRSLVALPRIFKDFVEIGEVGSDTNDVLIDLLAIAYLKA